MRDLQPYRRLSHTWQHQLQSAHKLHDEQEDNNQCQEKQLLALKLFANFLNTAKTTLNDITEQENSGHQVLGPGIIRICHNMADKFVWVASKLNREYARAA